jgi:hypothetical protein
MTKSPEMNWAASDLPDEYELFKQCIELWLLDMKITDKATQAVKIRLAVGREGLRRLNKSTLSADDQKDPEKLWNLFDSQINVKVNFRVHRLELMRFRQRSEESIDEFVGRCRGKASSCDFTDTELAERIMELTISSTPDDLLRKDLLSKPKGYKVDELLEEGRKCQALAAGGRRLNQARDPQAAGIDEIQRRQTCGNCGLAHPPRRCPAYNDKCKKCGGMGHWAKQCRSKQKRTNEKYNNDNPNRGRQNRGRQNRGRGHRKGRFRNRRRNVDETHDPNPVTSDSESQSQDEASIEFYGIGVIDAVHDPDRELYRTINIMCPDKKGEHRLSLKVDSGAWGNTLPLKTLKRMYGNDKWENVIQPTFQKLEAYNKTQIPCVGYIT